jgi:hypothetical protein
LALLWICSAAKAQSATFESTDQFAVPAFNGTINFAAAGTYTFAGLENDTWNFVNLDFNNSHQLLNLTVSAQNSNITIVNCQTFNPAAASNTSFVGVVLSYTVVGQGKQTFNFDLNKTGGGWSVTSNGNFVGENDGWTLSADQTLTVTAATANVTMVYLDFSSAFGNRGDTSHLPFYQQHSVAIATGVILAIAVALTLVIKEKVKRNNLKQSDNLINKPVTQGSG